MKVALKAFQEKAVRRVVRSLGGAYEDWVSDRDTTAVMLTAPTGAGKTVMATDIIEKLLDGSSEGVARPSLRMLWITSSPSLNRQSADKMDRYGDNLREGKNLVVIDEAYDEPLLAPGSVTFAHIQQLTSTASSWHPSEAKNKRNALWHAIARTIREHGDEFLLIIDEAHKDIGAGKRLGDRDTIIKTLLEGGKNLFDGAPHPAAPVALVMSATPDKFIKAMVGSRRNVVPVPVTVEEVQLAGLLKLRVSVDSVRERQKANHTLLDAGAADLLQYESWWGEVAAAAGATPVVPVMVVQVEDSVSATELGQRVATINEAWQRLTGKELPAQAFGHAFGEHADIWLGSQELRYISPESIDSDPFVRVVFFKEALTTGWDCPRAEVMVSLRATKDPTAIAQLVGRMVRTPGATHAPDERLESVRLYLPLYDAVEVQKVVAQIAQDTDGAVTVELSTELVDRNPTVDAAVVALIESLPKFTKPRQDYKSDLERAEDFAENLIDRGVVTDDGKPGWRSPEDELRALIVAKLVELDNASKATVDARVEDLLVLDTQRRAFSYADTVGLPSDDGDSQPRSVHFRDLDAYYEEAKRRLPAGSGAWYYEHLMDAGAQGRRAKMRVAAVSALPDVRQAVNGAASAFVETLRSLYADRIERECAPDVVTHFRRIWYPPTTAVRERFQLLTPGPVATQRSRKKGNEIVLESLPLLPRHVFAFEADGEWLYPGTRNSWEAAALSLELATEVEGWFRNPNAGRAALSVPYYPTSDRLELLHPDFIFVRRVGDRLVLDIVDPHLDHGDALAKWRGLAVYAADNAQLVRRALAIMRVGDTDYAIDVANPIVREAILSEAVELESLFTGPLGIKRIPA